MATCVPFQTQVSSIMEVLVKAAVAEISKVLDDKCAFLHLEVSRKQSEIEMLRRKLLMMENENAQLQRGFENLIDRGTDLRSNNSNQTDDVKFPEIEDVNVSFTIKEESPDESLWISDPAGAICNVRYADAEPAPEGQRITHPDVAQPKPSEFTNSYSAQQAVDVNGLQFTVKTEKEESQASFRQDGCQHRAGKQTPTAADYPVDERDSQLWSSLIEGNDIDGFPDFCSVVEEYSSSFSEHAEPTNAVCNSGKAPSAQQASSQRLSNGVYGGAYPKDAQLPSFPHRSPLQPDKQKDHMFLQRSASFAAQLTGPGQKPERDTLDGDGQALGAFAPTSFYPQPPHRAIGSATRAAYTCSQCGKSFQRLHQFKVHQQCHRRKRAFWCSVCGKSFQCSSHLVIHHRTHTGEKPFGCGQCGKRFTQQSSLRVHQRTHSGERPYSCSQCGKAFILLHHLKRHRILHTYTQK